MKGPAPFMRTQACTNARGGTVELLKSLQRHAAVEYGEVRRVLALKPGVGDHAPERFADHELGSCYRGLGQIRRRAAIDPWLERIYRTTLFDS